MTIVAIGERDQAKLTFLNNLSKIYCSEINKSDKPMVFKAQNSLNANNGAINIATSGSMKLLDSPGLNLTNKQHQNRNIFNSLASTIRETL